MRIALFVSLSLILAFVWLSGQLIGGRAEVTAEVETSAGRVKVEQVVDLLDEPWSLAFLPEGGMLVTQRKGKLIHILPNLRERNVVYGLPPAQPIGQGGLLDVVLAKDFAETREVFVSYVSAAGRATRTMVARGHLDDLAGQIDELTVIWRQEPPVDSGRHFGSRIVEARDGTLWVTIGDRGNRPYAQDLDKTIGKVIRIARDGSIPPDNPFVGQEGVKPEIWSYGHRNPQGAALDTVTGKLWISEHGAKGGDEINQPEAGKNYGWPEISYGTHYSGEPFDGTTAPGMEQPKHYWDPSIAPSGLMIYSGKMFPEWKGDIFAGALKFQLISRLDREGEEIVGEERLFEGMFGRIRDVREGPDGAIWFLTDAENGGLFRVTRAE